MHMHESAIDTLLKIATFVRGSGLSCPDGVDLWLESNSLSPSTQAYFTRQGIIIRLRDHLTQTGGILGSPGMPAPVPSAGIEVSMEAVPYEPVAVVVRFTTEKIMYDIPGMGRRKVCQILAADWPHVISRLSNSEEGLALRRRAAEATRKMLALKHASCIEDLPRENRSTLEKLWDLAIKQRLVGEEVHD